MGANDIEQIVCVFRILGSPTVQNWPGFQNTPDYGKITFGHFRAQPFRRILFDGVALPIKNSNYENKGQMINFLSKHLLYDAGKRIEASSALRHEFMTMEPTPFLDYKYRRPRNH
uniref:Uncharacterized protein n=1 Tax=Romanomermis culicivorax TaxID=13658 RepID=A0A915K667_ROMCU